MNHLGTTNPLRATADALRFPRFVADLLADLYSANLDIQSMNQASAKLMVAGFVQLGQVHGPFHAGDVAFAGSKVAIYDGKAWAGIAPAGGLHPPYRIYRRR
jgi:hypothetical protein